MPPPIPQDPTTCLLLIDNQTAFLHPTHWGASRSNPSHEANITALLSAFRSSPTPKPHINHIQHLSRDPQSPLHPDYIGDGGSGFEGKRGVDFLAYATPREGEPVVTKGVNSAFIGTRLEEMVRERGIRTLVIAGITTDHCVSTTTRMAANLGVVDGKEGGGKGRILLITDATYTFAKGTYDAETVHAVNIETLRGEFAEIVTTGEVLRAMQGSVDGGIEVGGSCGILEKKGGKKGGSRSIVG